MRGRQKLREGLRFSNFVQSSDEAIQSLDNGAQWFWSIKRTLQDPAQPVGNRGLFVLGAVRCGELYFGFNTRRSLPEPLYN